MAMPMRYCWLHIINIFVTVTFKAFKFKIYYLSFFISFWRSEVGCPASAANGA